MLLSRSKAHFLVSKATCPPLAMGWLLLSEPFLPREHMHSTQEGSEVLGMLLVLLLPLSPHHTWSGLLASPFLLHQAGPQKLLGAADVQNTPARVDSHDCSL